jgi:gliding motility-associated-like protein
MKKYIILCFLLVWGAGVWATHNRAGEIVFEQLDELTYRATIITYTKTSSVSADRDSLFLCWGDGTCQWVVRNNGTPGPDGIPQGEPLPNDVKYNLYGATHTYPGRFTYKISVTDPNRNGNILNVNPPNSDQIAFHLATTLTILNIQFQGANNSPILLQPPIDNGNVGEPFIHNPNAYDLEGDSLSYSLIVPRKDSLNDVDNYLFPDQIVPGITNLISLNPYTGEFVWVSPQKAGEYNIAILIKEYRNGQLISTMIRDMQITILETNNKPPKIEAPLELCVFAGDTVQFDVIATDPDTGQLVQLTTTGGPYVVPVSPAIFDVPSGFVPSPDTGRFVWITNCTHIRDQYYQVVFKADDNYRDSLGLSTQRTTRIKVIAPPPQNVAATVENGAVTLTWDAPYVCDTLDPGFRGFSLWRKPCGDSIQLDSCQTGLAGLGYTLVDENITSVVNGHYEYTDNTAERGRCYCYRVLATFAEFNSVGFPFNFVDGHPSDEACVQLKRDAPLLINVSVQKTDAANGEIWVRWTKPSVSDLDTLQNNGPYRYRVYRYVGFNANTQPVQVAEYISNTFAQANDTSFVDVALNTLNTPYTYKVALFVNNLDSLSVSSAASSIFLKTNGADESAILSWSEQVPWLNQQYVVYRWNPTTTQYDSLSTVITQAYTDTGLENGKEYCYRIKSIGSYGIDGMTDTLLNYSQQSCVTPLDTIPPCPPILHVTNECPTAATNVAADQFENTLTWTNPNNTCADDVIGYNIYFSPAYGANASIIETITNPFDTTYIHRIGNTLIGCYTVTAIDSFQNESILSNRVCTDNCPSYLLPNVFTPNADGSNDLYTPFIPYRFIDHINLQIFDRWGTLVFETTNPDINWNGTNLQGTPLAEGVYFYTCEVYETRLAGILKLAKPLSGYIHIIR